MNSRGGDVERCSPGRLLKLLKYYKTEKREMGQRMLQWDLDFSLCVCFSPKKSRFGSVGEISFAPMKSDLLSTPTPTPTT